MNKDVHTYEELNPETHINMAEAQRGKFIFQTEYMEVAKAIETFQSLKFAYECDKY